MHSKLGSQLNALYTQYNRPGLIHPDPLEFVYRYDDTGDREIAGLIGAALAYGRVAMILRSVDGVLSPMGTSPRDYLLSESPAAIARGAGGVKHRWTTGAEIAQLLLGIRSTLEGHGSLGRCFAARVEPGAENVLPALAGFVDTLRGDSPPSSLLSDPRRGSACKRLLLYLRWMVRADSVDPGCWADLDIGADRLVVPLDTHMHHMALALGATRRRQANMKTALDVTKFFSAIDSADPLRFDFALTRLGIRAELSPESWLASAGAAS